MGAIGGGGGGDPASGIGGGGGGGAPTGVPLGRGGGETTASFAGAGVEGEESLPAAESGLGGAMVPNRIDASWAALPAPGRSSSESSSSDDLSEPQSSESARLRDQG